MVVAPGSSIKSLKASSGCLSGCSCSGNFMTCSGTSMSTPHVSGVFALLRQYRRLEQNITLTPIQIQDALNKTGKQIDDTSGSGFFFSRINIYAALLSLDTTAPKINFVAPTPANNTKTSNNTLFINITSDEVLAIALLEFNGTNETMNGNGLNWFKNKTAPSNQNATYTYKVWGNDSANNKAVTEFRIFISNNTPPIIASFAPSELNITIAEAISNFTFNITASDFENDILSITWFQNISVAATNSNFTFQNNFTAAGIYNITAQLSDGNFTATISWNLAVNNTNRAVNITSFSPNEITLSIREGVNQTFNITYSDLDTDDTITITWYQNQTQKSTSINFTFLGNSTASGFYNITVIVSDGVNTTSQIWNLTVYNPAPNITSVNLTNTDYLNRTNGTLLAFWSFVDLDNDITTLNETLWYINNTLITNFTNKTSIHPVNTTKLENWTFSIRVFDGSNWSDFSNSSTIKILNEKPTINITTLSITVLETQLVNISLNASDLDNEPLTFTSNKTEFTISNNALLWSTNLTNSGIYTINVTVNDSAEIDSTIVNVTIIDARDLDNDGNPDFNETDDDNDGINDTDDFLVGNLSSINTTLSLNISINGTSNLSKLFNGTFTINITNGSDSIIEFNFTFNSSNILDFGNLTINRTTNGSSAVSIRGNINLFNSKKTAFLEKINTTAKSVCIKDADVSFVSISSACDSLNETLLTCDNITSGQYTCFDTGTRYKVNGLSHSAVKEQCRDNDGDEYGEGCSLGTDFCDTNPSQHTSDGCNPPSSGGSSGGGGGGGGGGAVFVCNQDWQCNEWSSCADSLQTRKCDFVKVPQHAQETPCLSLSNPPLSTQRCELPKQIGIAAENCNDGIKNQNEEDIDCGGICKPCETEKNLIGSAVQQEQIKQPTGFAIKDIIGTKSNIIIVTAVSSIAVVIVVFAGIKIYKRKQ